MAFGRQGFRSLSGPRMARRPIPELPPHTQRSPRHQEVIEVTDHMQDATIAGPVGIQKGRHEIRRESLEQLPAARFGRLPAAVTARLTKAASGQLTAWFQRALTVPLPDEVFAECPARERSPMKRSPVPAMLRPWPYWLLFAIVLLGCMYLLLRPTPVPQWFAGSDKLGHVGGFFVLVLLGYRTTVRTSASFVILLAGLIGLAIGSEWLQQTSLLPLRHANGWDLAANLSGLAVGLTVALALDQRRQWSLPPRLSDGGITRGGSAR